MGLELYWQTIERLTPKLRAGDLAGCEAIAAEALGSLPKTSFHIAVDLAIANDPADAAQYFDRFYQEASKQFAVRTVYTEMNGFDINPDYWICNPFAFTADGGLDDFDWLSDWQYDTVEDYPIIGLEPLQEVYSGNVVDSPANDDASDLCGLLVVTKFQRFIQRAYERMEHLRVPLYVTAHDYDYIARLARD